MTNSENKFRQWAKRNFPTSLINKLPDMKSTGGSRNARGYPDYMIIEEGFTHWYEIKMIHGKSINLLTDFTPAQHIFFKKMLDVSCEINVFIFNKDCSEHDIMSYSEIKKQKKIKIF